MAEKKKSKFSANLIVLLVLAVIGYVVGVVIEYTTGEQNLTSALTSSYAWIGLAVGAGIGIIYLFMKWSKKPEDKTKGKTVGKTAEGVEMDLSYNAKCWVLTISQRVSMVLSTPHGRNCRVSIKLVLSFKIR